jgi:ATP-dependent RNA helicase SUPV3L1/SUV3
MAVTALLGPTNTGKTHIAMERLLEHRSGMVGFPLRLLARENYERVVAARGPAAVALITGEERILPERPSYFICTAEAMPAERRVDFVAVDEVQLAVDRERGHVFTERLLHARGLEETMLLGSETIRPLVRTLVPEAVHLTRERLSTLRYVPPKRLDRLPRRSALIVFSLLELYEMAERLRREAGGAAVVFGALSPRTRNAQVGLYQAGEVDYLVATDAIGMGLNLDIDHVAFSRLSKFDGRGPRVLRPAEVAQIAGRAGRHVRDGTFGATAELGNFPTPLVRAVESHRFDPLTAIFWRNADLDFRSLGALRSSLEAPPPHPALVPMRQADDHRVLLALIGDADVAALARGTERVRLLWEVSQVPDFSNVLSEAHAQLLAQIYLHLSSRARRLPEDWVAGQVAAIDRVDGDVDTLLGRIASIRIWTYVSQRESWLMDPPHWQARTRAVEDRLSDALHERLTEQFVDRRVAVIARAAPNGLVTEIGEEGEVRVQGLVAGRIEGFQFTPEPDLRDGGRPLLAAANRALREGMPERVRSLVEDDDERFALGGEGRLAWRGGFVARLARGEGALSPRVEMLPSALVDPPQRELARRRLALWLERHLRESLGVLFTLREAPLGGTVRGLAFTLCESLGSVARRSVREMVSALTPGERRELARLGVTIGRWSIFLPALSETPILRLRARLWSVANDTEGLPMPSGRTTMRRDPDVPPPYYSACGYHAVGPAVWRVDRLERALRMISERSRSDRPIAVADVEALAPGASAPEIGQLLAANAMTRAQDGLFVRRSRRQLRT